MTFIHIFLEAGKARHVVVINCGERPESRYTVDATDLENTWVGFGLEQYWDATHCCGLSGGEGNGRLRECPVKLAYFLPELAFAC